MATRSSSISSLNDTPIRLPRVSDLNAEDIKMINLSQEEEDVNVIFETDDKDSPASMKAKNDEQENMSQEMKENIKRKKRLMRYDSSEEPMKKTKSKKPKTGDVELKKQRLDALRNPQKRI
jgi:hypothetical protein